MTKLGNYIKIHDEKKVKIIKQLIEDKNNVKQVLKEGGNLSEDERTKHIKFVKPLAAKPCKCKKCKCNKEEKK